MSAVGEIFRTVTPHAYPDYVRAFDSNETLFGSFGITPPLRIAYFLGQVLHETGAGTVVFESLLPREGELSFP